MSREKGGTTGKGLLCLLLGEHYIQRPALKPNRHAAKTQVQEGSGGNLAGHMSPSRELQNPVPTQVPILRIHLNQRQ